MKTKLSITMLHLTTDTASRLQLLQLRSRKQNGASILYVIASQKSNIPYRCHIRMNKTR